MSASRSVKLFGTDEQAGDVTLLRAGVLEATLDNGNLRYVRVGGIEALRAIAFLVRDRNWGTYNPEITGLAIEQDEGRFLVTYSALCRDTNQSLRYAARIEGRADGKLVFEAEGEALSDFATNRTGFVVLHALDGVVGEPVTVEHTDGRRVESRFPALVDPACPFEDVRELTHEIAPGLTITCRMEGDAFEMEDHRNWMDASYKTYVRPLAKPWPYTIPKGEKFPQKVAMTLKGKPPRPASGGESVVTVRIGGPTGHAMPAIGLAAPAEHVEAALSESDLLSAIGAEFLVCRFDLRAGHGAVEMQRFGRLGAALGADLVLEAVVPCLDAGGAPSNDAAILARDVAAIRDAAKGIDFTRVAISPATDLKCTLPGSTFPPAPSWEELARAARDAFPGAAVGGGMFSYFTELNRKRPPAELLDFICHSGCPIVHAGDDISVTETLEALPSIFATVRAFSGGKPYWVFPAAVSMRDNPYGAAPAENPDNIRQAMNRVDPRDRSLLGAAWYSGYLAHAGRAGIEAITLAAVAGPSGVVSTPQPHARPWFDDSGARAMPSYHVLAEHARLRGARVLETDSDRPREIQVLAVDIAGERHLFVTNLTAETRLVRIDGLSGARAARVIDEDSFEALCLRPDEPPERSISLESFELAPYAVARIALG